MSLAPSTRLGPYEVLSAIGAGGMGEVYRARDTRLERTVAIKVLPTHLSSNPQSRERFDREAKAISSLSHPHICQLYDVGHQDGVDFLVMEYLEGETLAHRLKKGALAPEQVLQYAIQITDALDAAHKHGVIHRDLKPGNIMLTKIGAKLLDFGLAKKRAAEAVAGMTQLPTETTPLTAEGTILGTMQYMAPEQLEGKEADTRTDIFALGAVLYEMATSRRAFEGKSRASLIAAILERDPPPISTLQTMAPVALDHVVRTCLAKDPDARWQTAHDVLVELRWIAETGSQDAIAKPLAGRRNRREVLVLALLASVSIALLILAFAYFREKPADAQPVRFQVPMPDRVAMLLQDFPVVSPDGRRLVFDGVNTEGKRLLWLRSLDSLTAVPLAGTEGAYLPFWSPDSRLVGFFSDPQGKLKRIDISGGPPQSICDVPISAAFGGSWNQDGVILFGTARMPLRRVSADGGEPQPVSEVSKSRRETEHLWPHFLPDGRHFLYLALSADPSENATLVGSLDSGQTQLVLHGASNVSYVPPGFLIYARQQTVMAQKFNLKTHQSTGAPTAIAEQVGQASAMGITFPGSMFSVSQSGVLVYRAGNSGRVQLAWYDRDGKRLSSIGEPGEYPQIALSPDDGRLAVERVDSGTRNLWIMELGSGIFSRLTFNPAGDYNPVWSPDGRELLFSTTYSGYLDLHRKALGGEEDVVVYHSSDDKGPFSWSKDGKILFTSGRDFYQIPLTGERSPTTVLKSAFIKDLASVSRDGRWVAYESSESGRWEIYVAAYPSFSDKRQVSVDGGCQPVWREDGNELFYLTLDGKLAMVAVKADVKLKPGAPRVLFQAPVRVVATQTEYAVTADGKRFIFREPVGENAAPITVVLNWAAGLKK